MSKLTKEQLDEVSVLVVDLTHQLMRFFKEREIPSNMANLSCYAMSEIGEMIMRAEDPAFFAQYQQARDHIREDLILAAKEEIGGAAVRS